MGRRAYRAPRVRVLVAGAALLGLLPGAAAANGGPFVLRYPNGDPAAKGVLARLDPTLKPARETRLRVLHEDLTIRFAEPFSFRKGRRAVRKSPPLAHVTAAYRIENTTGQAVEIDFGFPILRGIYVAPYAMFATPAVVVAVDGKHVNTRVISNSVLYGVIRGMARRTIDAGIAADEEVAARVRAVRQSRDGKRQKAVVRLRKFLQTSRGWGARDAALLAAYAQVVFKRKPRIYAGGRMIWGAGQEAAKLALANFGILAAIGEQKATQFFARLAGSFDSVAAHTYEGIFRAWGGDVRERSLDLRSGRVRPREVALSRPGDAPRSPSVYARVEYLNRNARLQPAEKELCREVLRNLPVVFTFAPMNLLHYRVTFPARSTRTVTVSYQQHAFVDTRSPRSFQLAYVLHPASLWKEFGPIRLRVEVPRGVPVRASVPLRRTNVPRRVPPVRPIGIVLAEERNVRRDAWEGIRVPKTGELLVAVDAEAWEGRRPGWSAGKAETIEAPSAVQKAQVAGAMASAASGPRPPGGGSTALGWLLAAALGLAAGGLLLALLLRRRRATGA